MNYKYCNNFINDLTNYHNHHRIVVDNDNYEELKVILSKDYFYNLEGITLNNEFCINYINKYKKSSKLNSIPRITKALNYAQNKASLNDEILVRHSCTFCHSTVKNYVCIHGCCNEDQRL